MALSMLIFYKRLTSLFLSMFVLLAIGCATSYHQGEGVVIAEKKLNQLNLQANDQTIEGAKIGGKAGMISGAIIGGTFGLMPGFMSGSAAGLAICTTIGGVIGGGLLGLTGAVLGGGIGYGIDLTMQNRPEYEFKIKQFSDPQILTIRQHSGVIPVHTNVRIFEKNGELFIRKRR